ncbi:MAG: hypothetical protein H7Z41_17560 [Cytophagales bacterium]|nr:hypothetical protein [Armatimonadota bacterium]
MGMTPTDLPGLVREMLACEGAEAQDPRSMMMAAERVFEKLRAYLSQRVGRDGFRTILVRALNLAKSRFPYLGAVRVEADGTLEGLSEAGLGDRQEPGNETGPEEAAEGAIDLISHFVGLLVAFIGGDLTLRILRTIWSTLPSNDEAGNASHPGEMPGREQEAT